MSADTTTKALLPCPFCGGDAFVSVNCADTNVRCSECFSEGPAFSNDEDNTQAAIDAWNHRDAAGRLADLEKSRDTYKADNERMQKHQTKMGLKLAKSFKGSVHHPHDLTWDQAITAAVTLIGQRQTLEAENKRLRSAINLAMDRMILQYDLETAYKAGLQVLKDTLAAGGGQ